MIAKWKGKRTEWIVCGLLFLAAVILFLTVGSGEPVLFDDSRVYLRVERNEGVMPLYPLFILLNQYIFGDTLYLRAVVVEQVLLSAFCLVFLVETIKRELAMKVWECLIVFCFLLYPYTIEMPAAMMPQAILSEGVSYSLFYLFAAFLVKAIWRKSYGQFGAAAGMALMLALTRSQMQILFGVCGIIFWYVVCMRADPKNKKQVLLRLPAGMAGCLIISLFGVLLVSRVGNVYQNMVMQESRLYYFALKVQETEEETARIMGQKELQTQQENPTGESEPAVESEPPQKEAQEIPLVDKDFSPSQFVSLIFSRGMYEADLEDADLFEDEVVRGLFLKLYETADAEEQLHSYEEKGLWMWKDIVDGIGMIGKTCLGTPSEFYVAEYPEIIQSDDFSDIRNAHLQIIGLTLLRRHFGRFLYHSLMLLPQAFISTIFFQIAPVYLLCHLVTLFLYLSALALMIWAYADRKADSRYAELMAFVLGTNVVLVVVISLIFYGQQRYLVYNFGIFYAAYCLLLQHLWRCRIKKLLLDRKQS